MPRDTRTEILDRAEALFAERGFYGVSIAAIVSELGLTKQALLHYFPTKEKLYGEVLSRISEGFGQTAIEVAASESDPSIRVHRHFLALYDWAITEQAQAALLMRELLDNRERAEGVGVWYLTSFLERLIAMIKASPQWQSASDEEALALAYSWLGAFYYFAVSGPTLKGIFGEKRMERLTDTFPYQLQRLLKVSLEAGPPSQDG